MRVFVYGTLKRGCGNHHVLSNYSAELIGEAVVHTGFTMLHLGAFPGVVHKSDGGPIIGELYEVKEGEPTAALDRLEGAPEFYHREMVEVDCRGKSELACMYVLTDEMHFLESCDEVAGNNW